jgi:transposase-like protein
MTAVATTEDHARRWAERARLDLEAAADRGESGLSKIRTAITERHDEALGYRSLGDYLRTEYADALGNVCRVFGVEFRRQVVAELTEAGLSTRAIAPVVGVSKSQVATDVQVSSSGHVDTETGEVSDDYLPDDATGEEVTSDAPLPRRRKRDRGASEGRRMSPRTAATLTTPGPRSSHLRRPLAPRSSASTGRPTPVRSRASTDAPAKKPTPIASTANGKRP